MSWPTRHTEAESRRIRLCVVVLLLLALAWVLASRCGGQEAVSPPVGAGGCLDKGGLR